MHHTRTRQRLGFELAHLLMNFNQLGCQFFGLTGIKANLLCIDHGLLLLFSPFNIFVIHSLRSAAFRAMCVPSFVRALIEGDSLIFDVLARPPIVSTTACWVFSHVTMRNFPTHASRVLSHRLEVGPPRRSMTYSSFSTMSLLPTSSSSHESVAATTGHTAVSFQEINILLTNA